LLKACDLSIIEKDKDKQILKIARGIMQVSANDVVVFLDV
jgi:F0F1-type ATP synthase epsilon subunit